MLVDSLLNVTINIQDSTNLTAVHQTLISSFRQTALLKEAAVNGYRNLLQSNLMIVDGNNTLLPDSAILEANEKKVNEIFLNTIGMGKLKFTATQESELLSIASQCSLSGGKAVYSARSLYSLLSDTLFDDKMICLAQGLIKSQTQSSYVPTENNFWYYPNPTSEFLTLNWNIASDETFEYKVINSLGQCIQQDRVGLQNLRHTINLQDLPQGVYYIQINTTSGSINPGKLFIVK